jgi:H+-transporting ATPase
VHSSDVPETANITKCLAVACAISFTGVGALVLLLALADPTKINWWHIWNVTLDSESELDQPIITNGQTIACMYLGLTCFIQLSILLTRNPSFWWHFSKKSAPRPSLVLVGPVIAFILAAVFMAVYWPLDVQPDGGLAVMQGAGWVPVLVTLLYAILWLQVADVAKVMVQRLFRRYEIVKEHCHQHNEPLPGWVRAIDAPGNLGERMADRLESFATALFSSRRNSNADLGKSTQTQPKASPGVSLARVSKRPSGSLSTPPTPSSRADYPQGSSHDNLQEVAIVR